MQFLYPRARQFPFDETCSDIVGALEMRNFRVPGLTVEFNTYGSGEQKLRNVSRVRGQDFSLCFGRVQRTMPGGRWNDTAAVTEIAIPRKELHVHDEESGPRFYYYVGDSWERDRETFTNGSKVLSKLYLQPKTYLLYRGGCDCRRTAEASFEAIGLLMAVLDRDTKKMAKLYHTHPGQRPPLLVHTNEQGREYDPEGDEPRLFRTHEIFAEFDQYLKAVVLPSILSHPVVPEAERTNPCAEPAPIPFPASIGPLFCFGDHSDASRITCGKITPENLELAERYGLIGSGYRLLSLDIRDEGTVPKIAYEGFLWCGIGSVNVDTPLDQLEVPGRCRSSSTDQFVLRVTPSRANDIYVADHAPYEKRRQELAAAITDRKEFTNPEVTDFSRARARTIVPIGAYQGGYEQPVVLVNRELSLDEVEVVSGPHRER